jgi:hypothetical protein
MLAIDSGLRITHGVRRFLARCSASPILDAVNLVRDTHATSIRLALITRPASGRKPASSRAPGAPKMRTRFCGPGPAVSPAWSYISAQAIRRKHGAPSSIPPKESAQQAGDRIVSLAFARLCCTNKAQGALARLSGFRAGFYGAPYAWPLGTFDPQVWAVGFIEGRGHRGRV